MRKKREIKNSVVKAEFQSRSSFYLDLENKTGVLFSYSTPVVVIDKGKALINKYYFENFPATAGSIKSFLFDKGLDIEKISDADFQSALRELFNL